MPLLPTSEQRFLICVLVDTFGGSLLKHLLQGLQLRFECKTRHIQPRLCE